MIRWSYVGPRLFIVALVWAATVWGLDPLLKRGLERGGSAALGARVTAGSLKTKFFPPAMTLSGFSAADPEEPMRNLFEFKTASFAFEGRPLLEKKVVVSAGALEGLALGTPRKSSGALPRTAPPPGAAALSKWAGEAKGALGDAGTAAKDDLTASYKVDPEQLASVKLARELEARWPKALAEWQGKAAAFDAEGRAKELEALVKKAESGGPAEKIAAAAELAKKSGELRQGVKDLAEGFKAELASAQADLAAARAAKEGDLQLAASKLKLPVFDAETLTRYLLGPKAAVWAARAARLASAGGGAKAAPKPAPGRRGVDVPFPKERSWPRFWLKKLTLSGTADVGGPLELRGTAVDWSSDPALVPNPARLSLAGAQGDRALSIGLTSDHRRPAGSDALEVTASGVSFPAQSLGEGPYAVAVGAGQADARGRVVLASGRLTGELALKAVPSSLEASAPGGNPLAARALSETLKSLKSIELKGAVAGTPEDPKLSLSSNIGAAAAGALRGAVGREAEERLKGVRAQIDKAFEEKAGPLKKTIDGQAGELLKKLGLGDDRLKAVQDSAAKRLKSPLPIPGGLDRLFR